MFQDWSVWNNDVESNPFLRLEGSLQSTSSNNAGGYQNPEMDALLVDLQEAPNL